MNSRDKQNVHYHKWLPQARKHFLKSRSQQMSLRISYKFPLFVSYDCLSYHRIEFNVMYLV